MDFSHYTTAQKELTLPALWSETSFEPSEADVYRGSFGKNEFIYMASAAQTRAYEIVKGYVKLSQYSDGGRETIVAILKPGDMLGNLSPAENYALEHAQALTKVELKVFESSIFKRAIRHNPSFVLKVLAEQQKRNSQLQRQIAALAFWDVSERLQHFLLFMGKEFGKMHDQTAFLDSFLTHHDISLINQTSRQSVTTILSGLKAEGVIYYDRRQLIIHMDKLKHLILQNRVKV